MNNTAYDDDDDAKKKYKDVWMKYYNWMSLLSFLYFIIVYSYNKSFVFWYVLYKNNEWMN